MFTLNFFLYLLLLCGAYLFRLSYIGWFGPYLMGLLAALPFFSLLLSLAAMLGLQVTLSGPSQVTKAEERRLGVHFHVRGLFPLSRVSLSLEFENVYAGELIKNDYVYKSVISSDGGVPLPTELCGLVRCRLAAFQCRDLLGLFVLKRRPGTELKIYVLPKALGPEKGVNIDAALNAAQRFKPKYGGGYSEEHELREYRPGDVTNSIHWKLSSKTDELIVREPMVCENDQVYLVLSRPGQDDRGLELLYWLSLQLCEREVPHVIISGELFPAANESESLDALRGLLSRPMSPPLGFDAAGARCVFIISGGEVRQR